LFIVAAPRTGSTLLFETLAASTQLCTLGGEAHWLIESIPELRPGAPGVDSNRLTAAQCTPAVAQRIVQGILGQLQQADGRPAPAEGSVRLLEKTPKNSLRIPFFRAVFPDARFIFLWRDPHDNLSSIMEAWRSGNWTTYRQLDGWDGPWSLLLPPGWRELRGKPLAEVAAHQWDCANRIVLEDLAALPRSHWIAVRYADLVRDPRATVQRIFSFAELELDPPLLQRLSGALPLSRYTQTPPAPDKWRRNEAEILRVLPRVEATWRRLQGVE
jgi:hypothetical protein